MSEMTLPFDDNHKGSQTSPFLITGIILLPIVFAWITLFDGFSTRTRVLSMAWMLITIPISIVILHFLFSVFLAIIVPIVIVVGSVTIIRIAMKAKT